MSKTLSEQVADLKRERDQALAEHDSAVCLGTKYRTWWLREAKRGDAAESREQQARVEGAREALNRCLGYLDANSLYMASVDIKEIRDREYPAPSPASEGAETSGEICAHCGKERHCRPTPPQAAPEPWVNCFAYEVHVDGKMCDVLFTDALCQRIVETARSTSGREG